MIILGIETATTEVGIALGGDDGVLASFQLARSRRHIETLTPAITFLCESSGTELESIDLVAVDIGPGGYTGVRVGLATARAIAHALDVPLIGVPSLDVLAFPMRITSRRIISILDARRGELYWASYHGAATRVTGIDEPSIARPDELARRLAEIGEPLLLVGNGVTTYPDAFPTSSAVAIAGEEFGCPSAAALVELARWGPSTPEAAGQGVPELLYLRPSYAREPDERG